MESANRSRLEEEPAKVKEEKEPKLKCHEMRLIFQRLPTSELVRFISRQRKHPLGKFWSQELKFVVEKRLPFSVKATATPRGVIFDCNGSHVAVIKRPKQFRLSPICELIERAEMPAIGVNASWSPPQFEFPAPDILSTLTSLDALVLSAHYVTCRNLTLQEILRGDPVDLLEILNPAVASRIQSLTLTYRDFYYPLEKPLLKIIGRATSLKKLNLPYLDECLLAALPDLADGYSGLESLRMKRLDAQSAELVLQMISSRLIHLCELFLPVRAAVRLYLAAFQALPNLTTLGLTVSESYGIEENVKQFSVDKNDLPIASVTELFIASESFDYSFKESRALLAILAKFPNVRTFGADLNAGNDLADSNRLGDFLLQFSSAVCLSGVFTHLQVLKLFCNASLTSHSLLQFIRANIDHLPSSVDLSQVKTVLPRNLDPDFLVDLCLALEGGRITSLALKDPLHRDAVHRLREHFALTKQPQDKSTPLVKVGKVLAWTDEDSMDERRRRIHATAWWPQAVSEFTDFRIEACQTSGPLKGSVFTVRISDWTEEREHCFDG